MVKAINLKPAFEEMVKCGLSKEKANQEIGFALNQINSKESLYRSNINDINNAVAQVAYTGLSLNHLKQEAVISDYNEKKRKGVWFLPMYRGLLKTAISEGAITGANTQIIFAGDDYEIDAGDDVKPVKHIIKSFSKDRKPLVSYTVLTRPNGSKSVTLFYKDEYELIKPKGDKFSPHTNWGMEMWKKANLKRALKTESSNGDSKLNHLIQLDNLNYSTSPIRDDNAASNATIVLPVLTTLNPRYPKIIEAIANEKADMDKVKENFHVTEEIENAINSAVDAKIKENEEKKEAATV